MMESPALKFGEMRIGCWFIGNRMVFALLYHDMPNRGGSRPARCGRSVRKMLLLWGLRSFKLAALWWVRVTERPPTHNWSFDRMVCRRGRAARDCVRESV